MNYFQIIQRVTQELKYPVPTTFANLSEQPQNMEVANIVNTVNRGALIDYGFNVRKKTTTLSIPTETVLKYKEVTNTINGEILQNGLIVGEESYSFIQDTSLFYKGFTTSNNYGIFNDKFIFTSQSSTRTATILYATYDFAVSSGGTLKSDLVLEDDESIIPERLHEQILVFGTCYMYKGSNSTDVRLPYWKSQYDQGLRKLNDYNTSQDAEIEFVLHDNLDIRRRV